MRKAFVIAALCCCPSCGPVQLPQPDPVQRILIPLTFKDTDWVCAETPPKVVRNYCVTIGQFRLFVQPSLHAQR